MSVDAAVLPSAGVPTSLPAFIGATANAPSDAQPVAIDSLATYEQIFGATSPGNLHDSIALFYENGGASCYVASAGTGAITASALVAALNAVAQRRDVTLLVIPDAVLLPSIADFGTVAQAMLQQAGTLGDRFAILDVYGGATATKDTLTDVIAAFRTSVGEEFLSYGAAYFPFLVATDGTTMLPPSGAMAGVYTTTDASGVWNAPANVEVTGISKLTYVLTDAEQERLTGDKAVNALRLFTQRAPVVWRARTLDCISNDYRYIQVRRTIIYIEQSIKNMLNPYMFAPNAGVTWATVTAAVSSFLTQVWQDGGLFGDKASDAFNVACGVGTTMTAQDVLDGYMIVQVLVAVVRPAEFIALTFQQRMAASQ